jgi:hypothetical protein
MLPSLQLAHYPHNLGLQALIFDLQVIILQGINTLMQHACRPCVERASHPACIVATSSQIVTNRTMHATVTSYILLKLDQDIELVLPGLAGCNTILEAPATYAEPGWMKAKMPACQSASCNDTLTVCLKMQVPQLSRQGERAWRPHGRQHRQGAELVKNGQRTSSRTNVCSRP